MATTQPVLGAWSGQPYGSFAGKTITLPLAGSKDTSFVPRIFYSPVLGLQLIQSVFDNDTTDAIGVGSARFAPPSFYSATLPEEEITVEMPVIWTPPATIVMPPPPEPVEFWSPIKRHVAAAALGLALGAASAIGYAALWL